MEDTICAISTSLGISAISIVRVTGPDAIKIVDSIFDGNLTDKETHTIHYGHIKYNNENIDEMIESIVKYKLPIVVIGKKISGDNIGSIYIDVKKAAEEIVDRYLAKGKDDIVYILPKQNLIKSDEIIE